MPVALTRSIGIFIENLAIAHLPPEAVAVTATGFTAGGACGHAGDAEPVVRIVLDALPTRAHTGEATLISDAARASAPDAALAMPWPATHSTTTTSPSSATRSRSWCRRFWPTGKRRRR